MEECGPARDAHSVHAYHELDSASRRLPRFAVKPRATPPSTGALARRPDEPLIFWGDTPVGSTPQIYWPGVSADEVIALADWMYGVHPLRGAARIELRAAI
jgi:hypothetical protein